MIRISWKPESSDDVGRVHTDNMKRIKNQEGEVGAMIMALCLLKEMAMLLHLHEIVWNCNDGRLPEINRFL